MKDKIEIMIDGKQIVRGRMDSFKKAIDIWKSLNPDTDLGSCDIVINIVPKTTQEVYGIAWCVSHSFHGIPKTQ